MTVEQKDKADTGLSEQYNDLILKAELADYSPVKGCMVIRPYGYAIWELIQAELDKQIKATGHQNAYFPMLIPESFLTKEKEHVEGFAPECAVVTHGGGKKLEEPLVVRPTSETIINYMFAKWVKSYRDLPLKINQWANVVRWEMRTRPFLRTTEFLWQEGHTAHATKDEAYEEAKRMVEVYATFARDWLALPVLTGSKTDRERFAGAVHTYCIEAMMRDGKALQAGTSHYLGQNFARAFETKFQTQEGTTEYTYQTSWGVSTRLIGALILGHMDAKGLLLPPKLAPIQVVIVPIFKTAEEEKAVLDKCVEIRSALQSVARVHLDDRENLKPGYKFNYWEMKGVPLRINVGPRDVEKDVVEIVRRDTGEKLRDSAVTSLAAGVEALLKVIQHQMLDRAYKFREENTVRVESYDEFKKALAGKNVFIECYWDGSSQDELRIKEETKATVRCIPAEQNHAEGKCMLTGNPTKIKVVFARSY